MPRHRNRTRAEIVRAIGLLEDEAEDEAIHPRDRGRAAEWVRALIWALGHDHTDLTQVLSARANPRTPASGA